MKLRRILFSLALAAPAAWGATPETQAVEFYNTQLGHYFLTADANEALGVDTGAAGPGWIRTGRSFGAWLQQAAAPAGAQRVCRFYSSGANSHFYTAQADECASVQALEVTQRQAAMQAGQSFTGWAFEGMGFMIQVPVNGQCPAGTEPISRVYNQGAMNGMGSNHRFVSDPTLDQDMMDQGWLNEGIAFCAPVGATGTSAPMMQSSSGFSALANTWSGSSNWVYAATGAQPLVDTGVALTLTITDAGAVTGKGNGCTMTGTLTQADGFREFFTGTLTLANCTRNQFNGTFPLRVESMAGMGSAGGMGGAGGMGSAGGATGSRLLMAHMHLTGAASQIDIAASLSAATTSSVVPASGSWSGTAAWIDSAQQMPGNRGGAGQMPGAVNQTLTLNLNNGVLAGTGYGCTFTGTLPGTVNAAGCTDATFNGSYEQVSLVLTGNVLTVNFGKGALDSGMMGTGMSVRIVGSLAASQ